MNQIALPDRKPVVFQKDGGVFATSRDVAEFFEKEVKHVHEAIKNMVAKEPKLASTFFRPFKIKDLSGESISHYEMTRDGFTLLAMGFTGTKALQWKLRYIEAFSAMEAQLRQQQMVPDLNDPRQLLKLLENHAKRAVELEAQVDELKPSADALDRIAGTDGSMNITVAAKNLQVQPKDLFKHLRANGWIYRRPGTKEDIAYQSKLQSDLLEHKVHTVQKADGSDLIVTQVRVTPKGLSRLAKELGVRHG
jgi:Rha family phage regulatory protein